MSPAPRENGDRMLAACYPMTASGSLERRPFQQKARPPEKVGSCSGGTPVGIVMTAPPSGRSLASSLGRGLKRKLGCIDPVTSIGRKKKLEHDYTLGREIGQGRFGAVRLCRSRASGEEFACKTLPRNGEETVHREVEIVQHLSGHPGVVTLKAVFVDAFPATLLFRSRWSVD